MMQKTLTQAEADREYIEAVLHAPIIDGGSVRNARRLQRNITLSEWEREARNRVCPHCGGGLKVQSAWVQGLPPINWDDLCLACNNGHRMDSPQDCPHHLELGRLETEAAVATGGVRERAASVADDMTALFGGG